MTLKSSLLAASSLAVILAVSAAGAGHAQVYLGHGRQSGDVQVNLDALDTLPSANHARSLRHATRTRPARHYAARVAADDDDADGLIVDSRGEHRGGHMLAAAMEPHMQLAPRHRAHHHSDRMAAIGDGATTPGQSYQGFHEATLTVPAPDDEGHIPPLDATALNRLQILCNASPRPPVSPLAERGDEIMPAPQMISATTDSVPESMGPADIPVPAAVAPMRQPATRFPVSPAPITIPERRATAVESQPVPAPTDLSVDPAPEPPPLSQLLMGGTSNGSNSRNPDPAPRPDAPRPDPMPEPAIELAPAPDTQPERQPAPVPEQPLPQPDRVPAPAPEPHAALPPDRNMQMADASTVPESPIEIVPQPVSPSRDETSGNPVPVTMQMAALELPPAPAPSPAYEGPADNLRVDFRAGDLEVPGDETSHLEGMVARLNANPDLRVELRAYAAGGADTASRARRLSLSRALAVQSYLTDHGIAAGRIDVRALGTAPSGVTPGDRVDMFVTR